MVIPPLGYERASMWKLAVREVDRQQGAVVESFDSVQLERLAHRILGHEEVDWHKGCVCASAVGQEPQHWFGGVRHVDALVGDREIVEEPLSAATW